MAIRNLLVGDLVAAAVGGAGAEELSAATGTPAAVVELGPGDGEALTRVAGALRALPCVLIGVTRVAPPPGLPLDLLLAATAPGGGELGGGDLGDAVAPADGVDAALAAVERAVTAAPAAAVTLALLLRGSGGRDVAEGLAAESAAYSMLLASEAFRRWRAARPVRDRGDHDQPRVRVDRRGEVLDVVLDRPAARNALDRRMRDELCQALAVAVADDGVRRVRLSGAGPAFCAGGDLDEFGSAGDPAEAHLRRLTRSPAALAARIGPRLHAHLHGACYGAGIELPAFAGRVSAAPTTRIALPELGLGLVPGAGGTVSLPRRIGPGRTGYLALTGAVIDAPTAQRWGLVDTLAPA